MTHPTIANPYQDVLRALVDGHKVFLADGPDQWMPQSAGDVLRQVSRGTYPPESYRVDKTPSEVQSEARSMADELLAAIDGPMRNPPHYFIRQAAHLLRRLQTENEVLAARLDADVAKSTLDDYKKLVEDADPGSPIERLRLFCSLAMRGQDWLDVEPLFTGVSHQVAVSQTVRELVDHTAQEKQATPPAEYWDAFIEAWKKEIGVDEVVSLMGGVQKLRAVYLRAAQGVS